MLITIVKNNLKLMFRNKMMLIMMIILPILVIAALSSAFHNLLSSKYNMDEVTVGYFFEEDSPLASCRSQFLEAADTEKIKLVSSEKSEIETMITDQKADVCIYSSKDGCQIYAKDTDSVQAKACQYLLQQFFDGYQIQMLYLQQAGNKAGAAEKTFAESAQAGIAEQVALKSTELPYIKTAEASDYYGIIEIIYFMWTGMIYLTAVVQSERKNKLQKRFVISPVSGFTLYLSKLIPGVIISSVSTAISAIVATLLFDIHWGNMLGTIGILFLVALAATSYGVLLLYIVNNLAVSVIVLFSTVWLAGFAGGSFETYMFADYSESIKRLSPLYYANRTIVEYSTMGSSSYTWGCVVYMLAITAVCLLLGWGLTKRRMEE